VVNKEWLWSKVVGLFRMDVSIITMLKNAKFIGGWVAVMGVN
jgi:hypothetical protein